MHVVTIFIFFLSTFHWGGFIAEWYPRCTSALGTQKLRQTHSMGTANIPDENSQKLVWTYFIIRFPVVMGIGRLFPSSSILGIKSPLEFQHAFPFQAPWAWNTKSKNCFFFVVRKFQSNKPS